MVDRSVGKWKTRGKGDGETRGRLAGTEAER